MEITIKVLPALEGDCILINYDYGNLRKNIIIDGGKGQTCVRMLKNEIERIESKGQVIDLLIVTHIDDDHINGILTLFKNGVVKKGIIKEVWFNSGNLISEFFDQRTTRDRDILVQINDTPEVSVKQGISFETLLLEFGCWKSEIIKAGNRYELGGAIFHILSPNEEKLDRLNKSWETEKGSTETRVTANMRNDYQKSIQELIGDLSFCEDQKVPNGSSIAVLLDFDGKKVLLLGDSYPSVVQRSLENLGYNQKNKLCVDVVKLSHHGSDRNTSDDLLSIIDCSRYIVSTNGSRHGHPHKACLARIIDRSDKPVDFFFNYDVWSRIFSDQDRKDYSFTCNDLSQTDYTLEV